MSSQKDRDNFFKRTGDNVTGSKAIKPLPKASEILSSLAKTEAQRAALLMLDTKQEEWVTALGLTVKS